MQQPVNPGPQMTRRFMLNSTATAAGVAMTLPSMTAADNTPRLRIIDSNVTLFQWPFRRLPLDRTGKLVTKLRSLGVAEAWAGSFEGLLHRDLAGANQRLAEECRTHAELHPVGTINPMLPGWKNDLRQCAEHRMHAIRLYPNYHGYTLADDCFEQTIAAAGEMRILVQIAVAMEDTRTQAEKMIVPDVNLSPLLTLLPRQPESRVQILNYRPRGTLHRDLGNIPGVYFDTARADGTDGVPELLRTLPAGRVLFGTHAPFLIPEAALIRTYESGQLDQAALRNVLAVNAASLRKELPA